MLEELKKGGYESASEKKEGSRRSQRHVGGIVGGFTKVGGSAVKWEQKVFSKIGDGHKNVKDQREGNQDQLPKP